MIAQVGVGNAPRRLYPDSVIQEILRRVSLGESVSKICDGTGFPHRAVWHQWVAQDGQLCDEYLAAIKLGLSARYDRRRREAV
jgi:hypothetical protein